MDLLEERVKNIEAKFVSVDEMFGFVGCLQQSTTADDFARGDQYAFLAIEQTTKLIICWRVGKRDRENAQDIMRELKAKTTGRFQLTTDNYNAYSGWSGAVRRAFGGQIDYGTETKHFATIDASTIKILRRFNPVKCISVTRTPIIGKPKRRMMTTNHSERCNLSIRLFNRRFNRKTIGYSKTLEIISLQLPCKWRISTSAVRIQPSRSGQRRQCHPKSKRQRWPRASQIMPGPSKNCCLTQSPNKSMLLYSS